ncbi:MAG: cytochrome c3 family protein [Deltaproteobacteria bacterium]
MLKNRFLLAGLIIVLMTPALAWSHQDVWLRNEQGDRITSTLNSVDPYSPKKTCGACHNYSIITSGYHFQQGFDVMKDGYDAGKPWILSPGMFGAWLPTAAAGRLAAKKNTSSRHVDLSTYDWIGAGKYSPKHKVKSSSCGSCHPGGGPMEYGRNREGGADWSKTLIGGEAASTSSLDGDYSSRFTPDGKSHFRQSGVVEADCLICHQSAYRLEERNDQLYRRNYRWAATAGAGLGIVQGAVFTYSNPARGSDHSDFAKGIWNLSKRPVVAYKWRDRALFSADGRMKGSLISKSVSSKSCLQCHAEGEAKNTGTAFTHADDVHVQAGMACTDCHPLAGKAKTQRLSHQIAKGKSLTNHVRDDLDGAGMRTCLGCHSDGQYRITRRGSTRQAKNPQATHAGLLKGALFHTYLISCNSCHAAAQPLRAMTILDMSTGQEYGYTADDFAGAGWPEDYLKPAKKAWLPWQTRGKKYHAAVPKHMQWFGEKMKNGEIRSIPLSAVARAARQVANLTVVNVDLPDGKKDKRQTVVSDRDITEMIKALTKSGFVNVVFVSDQLYELKNEKLAASPLKQKTLYYAVEHGVTDLSRKQTYGHKGRSDGCIQCHDDRSPFFTKMDIKNVREFLRKDYPALKNPNAVAQYEIWGLRSVPAFE